MRLVLQKRPGAAVWRVVGLWGLVIAGGGVWTQIVWAAPEVPSNQKMPVHRTTAKPMLAPPPQTPAEHPTRTSSPKIRAASPDEWPSGRQSGQIEPKESPDVANDFLQGDDRPAATQAGVKQSADSAESKPPAAKPTPPFESDVMPLPPKLVPSSQPEQPPLLPEAPQPPETTQSVQKLFEAFLEKPTKENYLQVLDALCRHPAYNPYSTELEEVALLLESRRYDEAKAKLDQAMPNLILSPRAHNYYRLIAEAAGDAQEVQRRDQIARKCLQGIQATGQGMVDAAGGEPKHGQLPAAPFHVARISDEYDLVRALGKRARVHSQSLRRIDGRWYDVLRCSDETGQVFYIWFDVTRPMSALKRQIQQSPQQSHAKENPP